MKRDRVKLTGAVIEHHRPVVPPSRALWFGLGFASAIIILALVALFGC